MNVFRQEYIIALYVAHAYFIIFSVQLLNVTLFFAMQTKTTALMQAAATGRVETVKVLLTAGADKAAVDRVRNYMGAISYTRTVYAC